MATPGALETLNAAGVEPSTLLDRHASGDWGEVPKADARENARALKTGLRLLSSYEHEGERLWVITEADRSSTCLLLPNEY